MTSILIVGIALTVSILIGLLVYFLIIRKKDKRTASFITKSGISFFNSPRSKITPGIIDEWTDDIANFWILQKKWDKGQIYKLFQDITVFLHDVEYLNVQGYKLNGAAWFYKNDIEISTFKKGTKDFDLSRVKSLYRHELSHLICGHVGKVVSGDFGENHHKLFKEVGLGA